MIITVASLGQTAVCGSCGSVYWTAAGHACASAPTLASLAAEIEILRSELAALDRGLVETAGIAAGAKASADAAQGHIKTQARAWEIWRDVADKPGPYRPSAVPQPRNGLYAVPTGGAA